MGDDAVCVDGEGVVVEDFESGGGGGGDEGAGVEGAFEEGGRHCGGVGLWEMGEMGEMGRGGLVGMLHGGGVVEMVIYEVCRGTC